MEKQVRLGVGVLVFDLAGKAVLMKRTGSHGEGTWAPPGGLLISARPLLKPAGGK